MITACLRARERTRQFSAVTTQLQQRVPTLGNPSATPLSSVVPLSFSPTLGNPGERAHNDRRDHSGVRYTSSSNRRGQGLSCPIGGPPMRLSTQGARGTVWPVDQAARSRDTRA